jgi:hypothetical protein
MTRINAKFGTILRLLPRTAVILMLLAAPVLALPGIQSGGGATIEAPALHKTGAGFVLLVGLRRG